TRACPRTRRRGHLRAGDVRIVPPAGGGAGWAPGADPAHADPPAAPSRPPGRLGPTGGAARGRHRAYASPAQRAEPGGRDHRPGGRAAAGGDRSRVGWWWLGRAVAPLVRPLLDRVAAFGAGAARAAHEDDRDLRGRRSPPLLSRSHRPAQWGALCRPVDPAQGPGPADPGAAGRHRTDVRGYLRP